MSATAPDRAAAPTPAHPSKVARSIGSPNDGRLDGGAYLRETPYLRIVPFYAESQARWGLPALVGLLDRAARRVARRFSSAVLSVGDLSRREGGGLSRHRSHESGRDADVGFYFRGADKRAVLPDQFLSVASSGKTAALPVAIFEDARNWALVEALVDDPETHVSYVFIASHLRARLLRFAEASGVAPDLRERAAAVMMQPRHSLPHDDHFHIRISCPEEQQGMCVEDAVLRSTKAKPPLVRARSRTGSDGAPPSARQSETAPRGGETAARALLPATLEH